MSRQQGKAKERRDAKGAACTCNPRAVCPADMTISLAFLAGNSRYHGRIASRSQKSPKEASTFFRFDSEERVRIARILRDNNAVSRLR